MLFARNNNVNTRLSLVSTECQCRGNSCCVGNYDALFLGNVEMLVQQRLGVIKRSSYHLTSSSACKHSKLSTMQAAVSAANAGLLKFVSWYLLLVFTTLLLLEALLLKLKGWCTTLGKCRRRIIKYTNVLWRDRRRMQRPLLMHVQTTKAKFNLLQIKNCFRRVQLGFSRTGCALHSQNSVKSSIAFKK